MKRKLFVFPLLLTITLFSCVSTKKFQALTDKYAGLNEQLVASQKEKQFNLLDQKMSHGF
jgi:hypothetical protein